MAGKGISLRQKLVNSGVPKEHLRTHLKFIQECIRVNPRLDISRYQVDPYDPSKPYMG